MSVVWRLEHPISKKGPYSHRHESGKAFATECEEYVGIDIHEGHAHPPPWVDGIKVPISHPWKCGFISLSKYKSWFPLDVRIWFEDNTYFKLVAYEIPEEWIFIGDKQVVFACYKYLLERPLETRSPTDC